MAVVSAYFPQRRVKRRSVYSNMKKSTEKTTDAIREVGNVKRVMSEAGCNIIQQLNSPSDEKINEQHCKKPHSQKTLMDPPVTRPKSMRLLMRRNMPRVREFPRTVELINSPIDCRNPQYKLLFMASLGLVPTPGSRIPPFLTLKSIDSKMKIPANTTKEGLQLPKKSCSFDETVDGQILNEENNVAQDPTNCDVKLNVNKTSENNSSSNTQNEFISAPPDHIYLCENDCNDYSSDDDDDDDFGDEEEWESFHVHMINKIDEISVPPVKSTEEEIELAKLKLISLNTEVILWRNQG